MSVDPSSIHPAERSRVPRIAARNAVVLFAVAQAVLLGCAGPPPATAEASRPPVVRLAGADRYEQSVLTSRRAHLRSEFVYLASGEKFADALSAASVAGLNDAPLLLVQRDRLPAAVAAEISRLSPSIVIVVGGAASLSDSVLLEVSRAAIGATVSRIGGEDRYEVSRQLILAPLVGASQVDSLMLATGAGFADALGASSAAVRRASPVMLVDGSEPGVTPAEREVFDALGLRSATIVGGPASVSNALEASLASATISVARIAAPDRYETAVRVNKAAFPAARTVFLASGSVFADALSGGPLAAEEAAPLYLVRGDCVPGVVLEEIDRLAPTSIVALGGAATLSSGVTDLARC